MKNVVKFLVIFAIIIISVIIINKDNEIIVCIDAGHGEIDAKAIADGIIEELKDELNG